MTISALIYSSRKRALSLPKLSPLKPVYRLILANTILGISSVLLLQACVPLIPIVLGTGITTGALIGDDRRTLGAQTEDRLIIEKAESRIKGTFGGRVHVNVNSFNRRVLLTGEAHDEQTRGEVEALIKKVENVGHIVNEIQISGNASFTSRTNDVSLTAKVKGGLVDDKQLLANAFKVITEAGVVYLMGLVTKEEGERSAGIAARTSGVKRVVRVFEYIEQAPRKIPPTSPPSPMSSY